MIDVDNFNVVNDTYGHDFGDAVLQKVDRRLHKNIRANDGVCRFGGEEFLIICHDTDLESVALIKMQPLHHSVIDIGSGFKYLSLRRKKLVGKY